MEQKKFIKCIVKYLYILSISTIHLSLYGQAVVNLSNNASLDSVPKVWRGHNHGAYSQLSWFNNTVFTNEFSAMYPGIIRWPAGNRANNFNWQENLNSTTLFNLKEVQQFNLLYGTALQIVVNFGNGSAAESAEFVKFCNSTSNYYTQLRLSFLGNSSPLNVKIWEIGNEITNPWTFKWSWLGHADTIKFRSNESTILFPKQKADSLYYYGGSFNRMGWIEPIAIDKQDAILGDLKFYTNNQPTDTILVEFPKLDTFDTNAVRVFRTPNLNVSILQTATMQTLYDMITLPANKLTASEFQWTDTKVILTPIGGISANDLYLIEYNSIGHDGAFSFRDSMKIADPSIQIGYVSDPDSGLASQINFQNDFANSPPDFMVSHPYATGIFIPAVSNAFFSEAVHAANKKIDNLVYIQNLWNQYVNDWNIPNPIGIAVTEWNSALYDDAPINHPVRGISSALYIANFWANTIKRAIADSIDLRVFNHFALNASGYNFIHLIHSNTNIDLSPEGKAVQMLMNVIGENMMDINIQNNPTISIIDIVNGIPTPTNITALDGWGGINSTGKEVKIAFLNKNDSLAHNVKLQFPVNWVVDSLRIKTLSGTKFNDTIFETDTTLLAISDSITVNLAAYSLNTFHFFLQESVLSINDYATNSLVKVYPNPSANNITFEITDGRNENRILGIYSLDGKLIETIRTGEYIITIEVSNLSSGFYFYRISSDFDRKIVGIGRFIVQH